MKTQREETVYLSIDEAESLVSRISDRCLNFNYDMSETERYAMAQLISDIGVKVSDLIDVSNLADNYAINSEIVTPSDYQHYNMREVKQDSLFSWIEDGETFHCLSW